LDTLIIGLGHKARQGKDYIAEVASRDDDKSKVVHFADGLKREVENRDRRYPLISKDVGHYKLLDKIGLDGEPEFAYKFIGDVPYLHSIMTKRHIKRYDGMEDKDSPILQFWGTDFRRSQDEDYWVKMLDCHIKFLIKEGFKKIYIPDVRFRNELKYIKDNKGLYVDVVRLNKDGTRWLDPSRDVDHASEIDLDNVEPDIRIEAYDGDLKSLDEFADYLKNI
jgi:hypothetical protein